MNLTTDKWIPIIWNDGRSDKVGLLEAFLQGDKIRDLAVRPHERIAVMRLLICVSQAALDGPKDREDWRTCRTRLPQSAADYLAKWKHAFELFGDGQRFLQMRAEGAARAAIDKLNFVDADMTTLFNQEVTPGHIFEEDSIVFRLLTYQSFAGGGTTGGTFLDADGRAKPQKGKNGPCRDGSALHCYLRADSLIETIYRNLCTVEDIDMLRPLKWGLPAWELGFASLQEFERHTDFPSTYLGRLAPLSRSLWLEDDRRTVMNANGLAYPGLSADGIRLEPAIAVVAHRDKQGRESRRPVTAKVGESVQHPWRELHSVLMLQKDGCGGPLTLRNADESAMFDLWVGAFVTTRAKVDDSVEFVFAQVPQEMLCDPRVRTVYAEGVATAVRVEARLRYAVQCYRVALEHAVENQPTAAKLLMSMLKREREKLWAVVVPVLSAYWTRLETHVAGLLDASVRLDLKDWNAIVRQSMHTAYELACPHGTPRQLKAYSFGLSALFRPVETSEEEPASEETEA